MADLRTTGLIDDFERPDENPIEPPWYLLRTSEIQGGGVRLEGGVLRGNNFPPTNCSAAYRAKVFGGPSGDIEVWALHGGSPALSDASRIGFYTYATVDDDNPSGYEMIFGEGVGGNYYEIRRHYPGGFTNEGTAYDVSIGGLYLFRKQDAYVNGWRSGDGGANWSLMVDYTDPSPFEGPWYFFLGTTGVETGWGSLGGGAITRSQIYRYVSN